MTRHIHTKRNENYSVVKGMLSVELEDGIRKIGAGESINILPGVVHRLYNETDEDVIAVEVDTGEEINEQDMLRMSAKEQLRRIFPVFTVLGPRSRIISGADIACGISSARTAPMRSRRSPGNSRPIRTARAILWEVHTTAGPLGILSGRRGQQSADGRVEPLTDSRF